MSVQVLTEEQKKQIESYLAGYKTYQKLLQFEKYKKEFFRDEYAQYDSEMPNEEPLARAKMFDIRHFILSLDNCDEKLLLYYLYVKGDTVERCAELLGISTRTAYRLKTRALSLAYSKAMENRIFT